MSTPSIFALMRQALAHGRFQSTDTRNALNAAIDALEEADNDSVGPDLDEFESVANAYETLSNHLVELLGSQISSGKDDDVIAIASADEEDEIERD